MIRSIAYLLVCLSIVLLGACSKEPSSSKSTETKSAESGHEGHDHGPGSHVEEANHGHASHGGEVIELGTTTIGGYSVRASRDQGVLVPGGDAPIDAWLSGGTGTVIAVRFWIGAENAAGSIKAKADIEDPGQPDHWHTHAEIPNPIPAGSKLWVELEIEGQGKQLGSFDLNE